MPLGLFEYAMFGLMALNHGMPRIDRNVGFGFVRWKVSVSPFALMPEMCAGVFTPAVPAQFANAAPPTIIWSMPRKQPFWTYCFGLSTRSNARAYAFAVTREPSLNLTFFRSLNV